MKAMILAAGRGERMRPLSDIIPKPLLKINGETLIERHIRRLALVGITEIVINISHLAEKIQHSLGDGAAYGVRIYYSYEPELLETGGGIFQALPVLGEAAFLLVSGDIWTDYPFEQLPTLQDQLAHLVCVEDPVWNSAGDFQIEQQFLLPKNGGKTCTYGNIGIISPKLLVGCQSGKFRLGPLFHQASAQKRLSGEIYYGAWHNIGSIDLYEAAQQSISSKRGSSELVR